METWALKDPNQVRSSCNSTSGMTAVPHNRDENKAQKKQRKANHATMSLQWSSDAEKLQTDSQKIPGVLVGPPWLSRAQIEVCLIA
jgi:hypothetical protein